MEKNKTLLSLIIIILALSATIEGYYLYKLTHSVTVKNNEIKNEVSSLQEETRTIYGNIAFIDKNSLKLREIVEVDCFDAIDALDFEDMVSPEIEKKSKQIQKGETTKEEFDFFYHQQVDQKFNNALPWCSSAYNHERETGREFYLNFTDKTVFMPWNPNKTYILNPKTRFMELYKSSDYPASVTFEGKSVQKIEQIYHE